MDVELPELIKCGYATSYLDVNNFWFSSGDSDSVIHNDDQDNVNCVLDGTKRFFMVDPRNKTYMENEKLGWEIAGETGKGYGAYGGGNDPNDINLKKFPKWKESHLNPNPNPNLNPNPNPNPNLKPQSSNLKPQTST